MLKKNEERILAMLSPRASVLDVGGWACPFNRADWVMDAEPYDTRGHYAMLGMPGSQGGERERFSRETWVQRDICEHHPWPFADKQFDFAICSQTLQDVRDPLFVCAELMRVARAGYIEVPSRLRESCRGWERPDMVGLSHHRWLVDVVGNHLQFTPKYHLIHTDFDLSFPPEFLRGLEEDETDAFLFWNDSFSFAETSIHGTEGITSHLRQYVQARYQYPPHRYLWLRTRRGWQRVADSLARRMRRAG